MTIDWYERQNELEPDMVFNSCWGVVRLDHRVPGDGSKWRVASWNAGYADKAGKIVARGWCYDEGTIEPGDLTERLPDDYAGQAVAEVVV